MDSFFCDHNTHLILPAEIFFFFNGKRKPHSLTYIKTSLLLFLKLSCH